MDGGRWGGGEGGLEPVAAGLFNVFGLRYGYKSTTKLGKGRREGVVMGLLLPPRDFDSHQGRFRDLVPPTWKPRGISVDCLGDQRFLYSFE